MYYIFSICIEFVLAIEFSKYSILEKNHVLPFEM